MVSIKNAHIKNTERLLGNRWNRCKRCGLDYLNSSVVQGNHDCFSKIIQNFKDKYKGK